MGDAKTKMSASSILVLKSAQSSSLMEHLFIKLQRKQPLQYFIFKSLAKN